MGAVVRIVRAIFGCCEVGAHTNCLFAVIMTKAPVGFPVPQMQEGLDEREAIDCFILDYIDYCMVMRWFEWKDGSKYDDQSEDGKKQWKKQNLCMSTLRATLPSKIKRLFNPKKTGQNARTV